MSLSMADMGFIRDYVYRQAAIVIDDDKAYLIESRVEQLARDCGVPDVREVVSQARAGTRDMGRRLVEAFATHETSFFRDMTPFDALRTEILPRLATARAASRSLTIWSAACSSGQEPYSIAMLLHEHFPALAAWPVRIIATDLSAQVLDKARQGKFRQIDVNRGLPATMMTKYFDREGMNWTIKPALRAMIDFRQLNLLSDWGAIRPDIAFMRNVLIYFDVDTKRRILMNLRQRLAPDGALMLGASETTLNLDDRFERVPFARSAYYQVRK